ncbi:MAG: HPt (histidine-containing phosphotransfer) domain-containing protein [Glaciecola sp.]|jgi:HPt (histidine-containing phosphotransfer) domain-containing protein
MESNNKVDITFLKSEIGNEKEFVIELLSVFKKAMNSFVESSAVYMSNENIKGIKDQSHKLAPTSQILGLEHLYTTLRKIEEESSTALSVQQLKTDVDEALQIITEAIPQIDHIAANYE